jgi:hypothetical protein
MATAKDTLQNLFTKLATTLVTRLGDEECPPAVFKEAREFLKDNNISKDTLDTASFGDINQAVPLDEFEDDIGSATH